MINGSVETTDRDLQLLKIFQFEKVDNFNPKTVVSHPKFLVPWRLHAIEYALIPRPILGVSGWGFQLTSASVWRELVCEQALLFGQAKRASRERRSLERSRETLFTRSNRRACSQARRELSNGLSVSSVNTTTDWAPYEMHSHFYL